MQLQLGDHFTDEEGEWEVTGHPFTMREGKVVHATIQKPGEPATAKEKTWSAHEHLTIQRAATPVAPATGRKSKRPSRTRTKGRA
jgi:hypothetical protein